MLTLKQLKDMPPGVFASGIYEATKGLDMKWVAVRGDIHDWAIYEAPTDWNLIRVRRLGNKIHNMATVQELVPADEEALEMYRH